MKTTLIVSALAATALSKPLVNKKWIVYTTAVDVVTVTATEGGSSGWSWGGWKHGSGSTAATSTAVPATTEAPATTAPAWTAPPAAFSTPAPAPAVTSAPPAAASSSTTDSYAQAILDQHNNHRQNASAPALTWSDDMASIAAEIAASCVYAHNT
jgi:hypothetical protein